MNGLHSPQIDAYIAGAPQAHQPALRALRELIHNVRPDAVESIQYKMPTFSAKGWSCAFSSRKHYVSLYCQPAAVDLFSESLGALNAGRGCIRFRSFEEMPLEVIARVLSGR